jgi:hypothetical protein
MARRRWSEGQMRELLQVHGGSGLSLKAFAAREGVPYTTLTWWRARLRRAEADRFVPLHVGQRRCGAVEIAVGDVVVRVADADEAALARLVRAIASC